MGGPYGRRESAVLAMIRTLSQLVENLLARAEGSVTDAEVTAAVAAHAGTPHAGGDHLDSDHAGLATAAALGAHEAAGDAHPGYLSAAEGNAAYDATGAGAAAVAAHAAAGDPHGAYRLESVPLTDADIAAANKDGAAGTASLRTLGAGATQATAGNDARLSDERTPAAHVLNGPKHTASGLTAGHVLRATGAAAFNFGAIADADLPATITRDSELAAAVATLDAAKSAILATKRRFTAGDPTYTVTGANWVDIDAANLAVSFVVPASGLVVVTLCALIDPALTCYWGLSEGATVATGTSIVANAYCDVSQSGRPRIAQFVVDGLTPGAAKTWKWAGSAPGGSMVFFYGQAGGVNTSAGASPRVPMSMVVHG